MIPSEVRRGLEEMRDPGIAICHSFLAQRGLQLSNDPQEIIAIFSSAAEAGDSEAQYALATLLWFGAVGPANKELAVMWCTRAADAGFLPALTMLADIYQLGAPGVPKDSELALALLEKAAAGNYPPALTYLGLAHVHGIHVGQDREKGLGHMSRAADLGYVEAQHLLGAELVKSADPRDVLQGMRWLRAAADKSSHTAHYVLSEVYRVGAPGVPANQQLAEQHLKVGQQLHDEWLRSLPPA